MKLNKTSTYTYNKITFKTKYHSYLKKILTKKYNSKLIKHYYSIPFQTTHLYTLPKPHI